MLVPVGTQTNYGKVAGISFRDGERYYFLVDKHGAVSLMPAGVVEETPLLEKV